jgi:hypothetical protein
MSVERDKTFCGWTKLLHPEKCPTNLVCASALRAEWGAVCKITACRLMWSESY